MPIRHAKQSGLPPDEGNPAHVEPTDWYADHIGASGGTLAELLTVTISLTSAQIATLHSSAVTVVAAQGAKTLIVGIAGSLQYVFGTEPFATSGDFVALGYTFAQDMLSSGASPWTDLTSRLLNLNRGSVGQWIVDTAVGENQPLKVFATDGNPAYTGVILTASINAGGSGYAPGDVGTIDTPGTGGTYQVSTVSNSFAITAVNQGAKTFTVTGDASAFAMNDSLLVLGSTGNDGGYTIVSAVFGAGSTVITVVEAIPSATADGRAGDSTLAPVGAVTAVTIPAGGTRYRVGNNTTTGTSGLGSGLVLHIDTITNLSDGTARLTVLYYVMTLL